MNAPIIELEGLTKCYGSVKAVDNLSLTIHKGEIFGLLGPNGAGKTTTILMMLGLSEPDAGTAQICGINAINNPIAVKRKVGYMPDSVGFYDSMTALENLIYIARLNGIPENEVHESAMAVMEMVGLGEELHKKTSAYSRGMKQRLGLADVLIRKPDIIVLDEPTLGIDPTGIAEFLSLIRQLSREQSLTVLLSSHHLHHVQQVCDRVGIFVGGKMVAEGNMESLARKVFGTEMYTVKISFRTAPDKGVIEAVLQPHTVIKNLSIVDHSIEVSCTEDITPDIVRTLVKHEFDIMGVQKKEFGLDEIYQRYFLNNQNKHNSNDRSSGIFQRSFFKRQNSQSTARQEYA